MSLEIINYDNEEYEKFLKCKTLPYYEVVGNEIIYDEIYDDYVKYNKKLSDSYKNLNVGELSSHLFEYQKFIIKISLIKKRYACFADCGLGKTAIFLEIARKLSQVVDKKILIISPLMIIQQTLDEEEKFYHERTIKNLYGHDLEYWLKEGEEKIGIINYEYFINNHVKLSDYLSCIILDESSILKSEGGKIRTAIISLSKGIPYKFAYTATPAPNDREEYANHALFLEQIRSYQEFFNKYFINRDNKWELKPHAEEAFYRSLANYSIFVRSPQNYGFPYDYELPDIKYINIDIPLTEEQQRILKIKMTKGFGRDIIEMESDLNMRNLFSQVSKGFILKTGQLIKTHKYDYIEEIVKKHKDEQIIIWTTYNKESDILEQKLTSYNAMQISGSMDKYERYNIINKFKQGKIRILISKPKLLGFGLNFQNCNIQIFSGMTDSYEQYYQAIKRCHRFGAKKDLLIYFPMTYPERIILNNVMSKKEMIEMDALKQEKLWIKWLKESIEDFVPNIKIERKEVKFHDPVKNDNYEIYNGDNVLILDKIPEESIDFSIFSPPFSSLFTYTDSIYDMGNCSDNDDEFALHFLFFLKRLFRVMKSGRIVCIHLSQLATFKNREGYVGVKDFRGLIIKLCEIAGFHFFGEWIIRKNPQMQAIKEKVRTLQFAQLESDRLGCKPGFNDMILILKKPGEPKVKVNSKEVTRDEWIEWACGVWTDIRESDTLNIRGTKSEDDVKHVCPLNLTVINRCIRMYSNPNEVVLSPFMGIGSEGVVALNLYRKFVGIELKREYFEEAKRNLDAILKIRKPNRSVNLRNIKKVRVKKGQVTF